MNTTYTTDTKHVLYIGGNYGHTYDHVTAGAPIDKETHTMFVDCLMKSYEIAGYTVVDSIGIWKGDKEYTKQIIIYGQNDITIFELANELKRALCQDCILIEKSTVDMAFV